MQLVGDPQSTIQIQMWWESTIELYPSRLFRFIDNLDEQYCNGTVLSVTQSRCHTCRACANTGLNELRYPGWCDAAYCFHDREKK